MERAEEAARGKLGLEEKATEMSRKEKRKAMKKLKRKQVRKEIAAKEREEAEAQLNDPAEQEKLRAIEEEEARNREKELKEFEESERAWREAMEIKRKKEEEEEANREEEEKRWKDLEELRKLEASGNDECGEDEDGEYEYIEEGPLEIIFQGNEVILRKNKVKVPKKSVVQVDGNKIADRPTSNPLPPGTEALPSYQNVSSAQQILDNVAQEVPNFGTEQDKAHCPFHLKTGACRFGTRCNRVHFYPDKSCTILMKNMYNGPGIAWEHDEGLEVCKRCHLVMLTLMDSLQWWCMIITCASIQMRRLNVVTKNFMKMFILSSRSMENLLISRNGSFHLKGNVYVHYRSLESAILAYQSINGRYFAGKQVKCEFVNISRWKVAICGEYMKSRLKFCSHGSACNFIHCFRNPGGDYEWADHDRPPPRCWIHRMTALFGYSDEYLKEMERETLSDLRSEDSHRRPSRRSRSRDHDRETGYKPSYKNRKNHVDVWESTRGRKLSRRQEENCHDGSESPSSTRDGSLERKVYRERWYGKETSHHESKWSEHSPGDGVTLKKFHGRYSDDDSSDGDDYGTRETGHKKDRRTHRSSRKDNREGSSADQEESHEHDRVRAVGDKSQRERSKHRHERSSSSRYSHEEESVENRHHPQRGSDLGDDDRKRSFETSPREHQSDKDRDKSKQRHPDSDRSRKGKRHRRSSRNGVSVRESQELNGNGKRENVNCSSSDEESSDKEETHKGRPHRHRKRRRSQQSQDQKSPKEEEGEIERWRPM